MAELRAAFASPQGQATAADAARLRELARGRSMTFTAEAVFPASPPSAGGR
jgi:hypothetical protein